MISTNTVTIEWIDQGVRKCIVKQAERAEGGMLRVTLLSGGIRTLVFKDLHPENPVLEISSSGTWERVGRVSEDGHIVLGNIPSIEEIREMSNMKPWINPDNVWLLNQAGLNNKEIATKLGCTPPAIDYWIKKLGLTNNCHKKQDDKPALKCPQCGHEITAEEVRRCFQSKSWQEQMEEKDIY